MKTIAYFLLLGLGLLNLGCPARSFSPLFTAKDLVSVPAIVGTWVDHKGETFTFQRATDNSYNVVWWDQKNTGVYKVQIGMLGKSLFLDSYPGQDNPDYAMIHTHLISRISLDGDSLHIASLEGDWLKHMIESAKLTMPHVVRDGDILLTASTEELQAFVLRYAEDTGAFPTPEILVRMK
jgi:hypothetical protein